MNDILIVPDIHGRDFWRPALDYPGQIIFLGDYTDPYPSEGFTQENAYQNLLEIVELKRQNPDRVTLLVGNHELHYYNDEYRSSRFSEEYYERYHKLLTGEESLFQVCKQVDEYLFTHAGVTEAWQSLHCRVLDEMRRSDIDSRLPIMELALNKLFHHDKSVFYEISRHRGGGHPCGSPLWADIREHIDEACGLTRRVKQVFGHTMLLRDEPFVKGNVYMLDNLQLYLLRGDILSRTLEKYK
jgi:hypothetical protein